MLAMLCSKPKVESGGGQMMMALELRQAWLKP